MLRRTHVEAFLQVVGDDVEVDFLQDPDGRVVSFLSRLCRLVRRLEGSPRSTVLEALRRQERRVRDARRLSGVSKALVDLCAFRPPPGARQATEVREALFEARGGLWPPIPGDERFPYARAAAALSIPETEIDRLLYADDPAAAVLVSVPRIDGPQLLDRYNLELARGVLLDADRVVVTARGGWKAIFRAVKLARLMHEVERVSLRRYRLTLTGPAAQFITRNRRYGARFARMVPAITRAPGWRIEATVVGQDRPLRYVLDRSRLPFKPRRRRRDPYDSSWERALAKDFAQKLGDRRDGWTLIREETPVVRGEAVFLPDFTLRHQDGREALVEIVGFWAPEYLERKLRKVREAGLDHLVLVVYRSLAAGAVAEAAPGPVLWFTEKPKVSEVLEAVERVARRPDGREPDQPDT